MNIQKIILSLRSPLFLIASTALIVLLLISAVTSSQQQKLLDIRTAHYGNALAEQAANQAANATINDDRVSLQITLKEIVANPDIFSATIHDVENKLLVQAGNSPSTGGYDSSNSANFTAPITLHDSIAGFLTVTVDTQSIYKQQDTVWILGLAVVCLALIGLSLMSAPTSVKMKLKNKPASPPTIDEDLSPITPKNTSTASTDLVEATLMLRACNIDMLRKQINSSLKTKLYDELAHKLDGINMLYSGKVESASDDWITIKYSGSDSCDASFRAICGTLLLFSLLQDSTNSLQLEFSAAVFISDNKPQLSKLLASSKLIQSCQQQLIQRPQSSLLLHNDSCVNDALQQRIRAGKNEKSAWLDVEGLQSAYESLLTKQSNHLQRILQNSTN